MIALLGVGAWLWLWNLGNGYLWQDEAETALLARHTLQFGYPRAFDGRNYIDIPSHGYGPGEAWIYSPWLPFYLLAGVFAVAGESTWVARLPFALCGLLSVVLLWRLTCRLTRERSIQRLSVALLVFSVPFALHMRQCRYYAMTTALLVGLCLAYLAFLDHPSLKRGALWGLLLVLLFHTNFGAFMPALAAVGAHQALRGTRVSRWRAMGIGAVVLALTLPWAAFFYRPAFVGTLSLSRLADHLEYYVRITNKHFVPLVGLAVVSALVFIGGRVVPRRGEGLGPEARTGRSFLLIMVLLQSVFLLIPDQRHMRYLVPTLPLLFIGEAWWLAACLRRNRWIGGLVVALATFTTALHAGRVHVPLRDLVDELTHPYVGPMEGIVRYLRVHGRPEQAVKIPYDDRTIMFYTRLRVERPSRFLHEDYPEWVVIRRGWIPQGFFAGAYFRRIEALYDRIELPAPDTYWQNREDPGEHHFRTVGDAPRVVIYRKRDAGDGQA